MKRSVCSTVAVLGALALWCVLVSLLHLGEDVSVLLGVPGGCVAGAAVVRIWAT